MQGSPQRYLYETILWKVDFSRVPVTRGRKRDANSGISAPSHTAGLNHSPAKGLKRMATKVQWLCWKSQRICVVYFRDVEPDVFIDFTEKLNHAETNPKCTVYQGHVARSQRFETKTITQQNLPRRTSSAKPERSKIWGSASGGDRKARALCSRNSVEAGEENPEIKGEKEKLLSSRLRNGGVSLHHPKLNRRKESSWWTPARRCIWSAKRTWIPVNWKTVKVSRIPITVVTANGEVQMHEEATVYV